MATTATETRFTALPDGETLAATTVALEEHGFSVEVVDDLDAARRAVLDRIPTGASVMTNTSVTLEETGIAEAINSGGTYESPPQQAPCAGLCDGAARDEGSRRTGRLRSRKRPRGHVRGDASCRLGFRKPARPVRVGSRPGSSSAAPRSSSRRRGGRERILEHSLPLEDVRASVAYGMNSRVGKILEIRQEDPGRIHIVIVREAVGF